MSMRLTVFALVALLAGGALAREARRPLPPRRPPVPARAAAASPKRAVRQLAAGPACVDVLVAYDRPAALWAAWRGGGVTNFATAAVGRMNAAVTNSNLQASLVFRLVGVQEVAVEAKGDFDGTLTAVTDGIGGWAEIPAARDRLGADIVMTLIDTGSAYGTTGLSWAMVDTDYAEFAEYAYGVCAIRSVAESETMTHEVGHLLGAGHADAQLDDPGPQLFPYSSGYYFETNGVPCRTIMAYDDDGFGNWYEEVSCFSTPAVKIGGVAVGTALNDNARTLLETAAAVAAFRTEPRSCVHDRTVDVWEPGRGEVCEAGSMGDVWQWCPSCAHWFRTARQYVASRETFVICHGHANSIDEIWIRDMASALPSSANVLAVNWGEGADQDLPHLSAAAIPTVVSRAGRRLRDDFKLDPARTTLIGHSHGAHVAANLVYDLGEWVPFARFVGLDTSTDAFGVHELNRTLWGESYGLDRWRKAITNRCRQVEFYKTSWIMSLSRENAYGHYSFVVVEKDGLPERLLSVANVAASLTDIDEIARHSYAHEWFTATIADPVKYASVGYNFTGSVALTGAKGFCGLIRDSRLLAPMGYFVTFDGDNLESIFLPPMYCDYDRVYQLPTAKPSSTPGYWRGSNGRLYEPGLLIFNLGQGGETIRMTR